MLGPSAKTNGFALKIPANHGSLEFHPRSKILIDTIPKLESHSTHTKQTAKPNSNRYKTGQTGSSMFRDRKAGNSRPTRTEVLADMPNGPDSPWPRRNGGFKLNSDFGSR